MHRSSFILVCALIAIICIGFICAEARIAHRHHRDHAKKIVSSVPAPSRSVSLPPVPPPISTSTVTFWLSMFSSPAPFVWYQVPADNTTCTVLSPTDFSVTVYPIDESIGNYGLRWSTNCNGEAPNGPPLITSGSLELGFWEGYVFNLEVDLVTPYTASFYSVPSCKALLYQEIGLIPNSCTPFYQTYFYPNFAGYALLKVNPDTSFTLKIYRDPACKRLNRASTQFNVTGTVGTCQSGDAGGALIAPNQPAYELSN